MTILGAIKFTGQCAALAGLIFAVILVVCLIGECLT